jgi:exosortase
VRTRLPLLAALAAGALLYAPVLAAMGRQWVEDTTTAHGILLAAAAAVVVYRKLPLLRRQTIQPDPAGVWVVLFGLAIYLLGTLGAEVFVQRFSMPIVAIGCVTALAGRRQTRLLLGAFALLWLAIPLPAVIVTATTLPMQLLASRLAETLLTAGSIPVMRDGNLLRLDHATIEVAEACSGLRSAISLISVGAVCTVLMSLRPARAALLISMAIPIAIVGNGARVAATGYMTQWFGEWTARGVVHDLTGLAAFAVMLATIIAVLRLTRPSSVAKPPDALPART